MGIGVSCIILGLLLAWLVVGIAPPRFLRAMVPTLAVAISTQSSLASLPAMLKSSEDLGVDPKKADVVLPLAVALFRFTSPAMNLAVVVRSEEHTSELQSLMRISYAVFCLTKKKQK